MYLGTGTLPVPGLRISEGAVAPGSAQGWHCVDWRQGSSLARPLQAGTGNIDPLTHRFHMTHFLISLLVTLSLWPGHALVYRLMCLRYGHVAMSACVVSGRYAFARARLLIAALFLPVFLFMLARQEALHWLAFCYLLTMLTLTDVQMRLLPDYLLVPLLLVGLVAVMARMPDLPVAGTALIAFAGTGVLAALCVAVQRLIGREGLATGDLKLITILAVWFSYERLPLVLLLASFAGLVYILVIRFATGEQLRAIAFGPWLACGALAVHLSNGLTSFR